MTKMILRKCSEGKKKSSIMTGIAHNIISGNALMLHKSTMQPYYIKIKV